MNLIRLCILCGLVSFFGGRPARAQTNDEASLRAIAERFLAAYQTQDLDGLMSLLSEKSPHRDDTRKTLVGDLAASKDELRSLSIGKVTTSGDKASVRVAVE